MVRRCIAEKPSGWSVSSTVMALSPWVRGPGREPGPLLGDRLHLQPGDDLRGGLVGSAAHDTSSAAARARAPRSAARARRAGVSSRVLRRSRTTTSPSTSTSVTSPRPAAKTSSAATSWTGVRCGACEVEEDEVGPLADLDRADSVAEAEGARPLDRRGAQDLVGARDVGPAAREPGEEGGLAHRLPHVEVVAARAPVGADAEADPAVAERGPVEGAAGELEVRPGAVARRRRCPRPAGRGRRR